MLGGIAGDIIGSAYEKRNYRAKDFEPLFHARARFTDDTVCIVAIADAMINSIPHPRRFKTGGDGIGKMAVGVSDSHFGWPMTIQSPTDPGATAVRCGLPLPRC